ncbi:MAG: hypothetical protein CR971_01815 [candidate division SR1 bacterium]|nr:MAG: hypothetical protein CR971_01815 [candidate division SR1 bacterium]
MKKKILSFIFYFVVIGFFGITNGVFATDIDGFLVTVPKTLSVNEAVDMEISAVKDGNVVSDYKDMVFIRVDGGISGDQVILPGGGTYNFEPTDQGKKLFSKGFKIMKAGTYTLVVESIIDDSINSQTTIVVKDKKTNEIKNIDIISPTNDGVELGDTVDIIGSSIDLPNTPVQIFLNGQKVASTESDTNGDFSSKVSLSKTGDNNLEIKAFDINNNLIGKSARIHFKVDKNKTIPAIKEVIIDPGTTVEKASKITITLKTRDDIKDAKIILNEKKRPSMDNIAVGEFKKSFLAQKAGKIKLKFMVIDKGEEKIFDKNTVITVNEVTTGLTGTHDSFNEKNNDLLTGEVTKKTEEEIVNLNRIGDVIINPDSVDGSKINISWENIGDAKKFKVSYGLEKTTLKQNIIVDSTKVNVEKIDPKLTYFFLITPLNDEEVPDGNPSNIIEYTFGGSNTCTVGNIHITTKRIENKNYLTWTAAKHVEKYEIYRSDTADSKTTIADMDKIGETKDTKFEYPFDINAPEEKYAYYAIQAVCKGGQKIQIGNVEKVKTGPIDNLIAIIVFSALMFSMYKLYKISA